MMANFSDGLIDLLRADMKEMKSGTLRILLIKKIPKIDDALIILKNSRKRSEGKKVLAAAIATMRYCYQSPYE